MSKLILDNAQPTEDVVNTICAAQEQTILFSEQAARLLANVKIQYSEANELITDGDAKDLEIFINNQIKGYSKLELYGGLKIVSAKVRNEDGVNLHLTLGVKEDMRLYKNNGAEKEFYIGWQDGKDLYINGGKLRIRANNNPAKDAVVNLDTSQLPEAREARERAKWLFRG